MFTFLVPTPIRRVDLTPKKRRLRKDQKVLLRAAEVIEERGWTAGTLENSKGAVCILGAINVAVTGSAAHSWGGERKQRLRNRAIRRVVRVIGRDPATMTDYRARTILWEFNDYGWKLDTGPGRASHGTRAQKVVATLRRAAELEI